MPKVFDRTAPVKVRKDRTGRTYGWLKVVSRAPDCNGVVMWKCICSFRGCGRETVVAGGSLQQGQTRSCGCYNVASRRSRAAESRDPGGARANCLNTIRTTAPNVAAQIHAAPVISATAVEASASLDAGWVETASRTSLLMSVLVRRRRTRCIDLMSMVTIGRVTPYGPSIIRNKVT